MYKPKPVLVTQKTENRVCLLKQISNKGLNCWISGVPFWVFVILAQQFHWQEEQHVVWKAVLSFLTRAEQE